MIKFKIQDSKFKVNWQLLRNRHTLAGSPFGRPPQPASVRLPYGVILNNKQKPPRQGRPSFYELIRLLGRRTIDLGLRCLRSTSCLLDTTHSARCSTRVGSISSGCSFRSKAWCCSCSMTTWERSICCCLSSICSLRSIGCEPCHANLHRQICSTTEHRSADDTNCCSTERCTTCRSYSADDQPFRSKAWCSLRASEAFRSQASCRQRVSCLLSAFCQ